MFETPSDSDRETLPRSAFVLIPRGSFFAAVRAKKNGSRIECPGGKCHPGESPEDAARREVREELGVELEGLWPIIEFVVTVPGGARHLTTAYLGSISPAAEMESSPEGEALWASREDFAREGTYPDQFAQILSRLREP